MRSQTVAGPAMYHLTEAYLMALFISLLAAGWGVLAAGSSAVPVLFARTLDEGQARLVLRRYWPGYFKFAIVLGLFALGVIAAAGPFSALPGTYTLLLTALAGLMTTVFYVAWTMIPRINDARDAAAGESDKIFDRLHRANVALTGTGLVLGIVLLAALIYVLPGQFTFWPTVEAH
jgi:hypothetical protein